MSDERRDDASQDVSAAASRHTGVARVVGVHPETVGYDGLIAFQDDDAAIVRVEALSQLVCHLRAMLLHRCDIGIAKSCHLARVWREDATRPFAFVVCCAITFEVEDGECVKTVGIDDARDLIFVNELLQQFDPALVEAGGAAREARACGDDIG